MSIEQHSKVLADVFQYLRPEMALAGLACVLFLGGTFQASRALWAIVTLAGLALAGVLLWSTGNAETTPEVVFGSPLVFDSLTRLVRWIAAWCGGGADAAGLERSSR